MFSYLVMSLTAHYEHLGGGGDACLSDWPVKFFLIGFQEWVFGRCLHIWGFFYGIFARLEKQRYEDIKVSATVNPAGEARKKSAKKSPAKVTLPKNRKQKAQGTVF